ncbi:MAG: sigma-54 dependent transcriptional regulator [Nannocystaceae bacterium]|nr:sigma-54 dependent transcriptional regulator [Nannocystaceae bacterium]
MPNRDHAPIRVLAVDDDPRFCELISDTLTGCSVATVHNETDALSRVQMFDFDVVLTDVNIGGIGGIAVCQRIAEIDPDLPVVVITGFGSIDTAVAAMRAGAYDFVTKPVEMDSLRFTIQRAAGVRALRREVNVLRERVQAQRSTDILGESVPTRRLLERVARMAESDAPVLIRGESGTGKELVGRAIHAQSKHAAAPLVTVNLATLPAGTAEAELFGTAAGPGEPVPGAFERAGEGTVLLDEIGELPLELQPRLLRLLEAGLVRRAGSDLDVPVRARVIATTSRDLDAAVEAGTFRPDLLLRASVLDLSVPPLRARGRDILLLAQHFLLRFAAEAGKDVRSIGPELAQRMVDYPWPGNVRELRNTIERAVTLARGPRLELAEAPERIRNYARSDVLVVAHDPSELVPLDVVEQRYILRVLEAVGENKTLAAKVLGLGRKTLYRKLERYGVIERTERKGNAADSLDDDGGDESA